MGLNKIFSRSDGFSLKPGKGSEYCGYLGLLVVRRWSRNCKPRLGAVIATYGLAPECSTPHALYPRDVLDGNIQ